MNIISVVKISNSCFVGMFLKDVVPRSCLQESVFVFKSYGEHLPQLFWFDFTIFWFCSILLLPIASIFYPYGKL